MIAASLPALAGWQLLLTPVYLSGYPTLAWLLLLAAIVGMVTSGAVQAVTRALFPGLRDNAQERVPLALGVASLPSPADRFDPLEWLGGGDGLPLYRPAYADAWREILHAAGVAAAGVPTALRLVDRHQPGGVFPPATVYRSRRDGGQSGCRLCAAAPSPCIACAHGAHSALSTGTAG